MSSKSWKMAALAGLTALAGACGAADGAKQPVVREAAAETARPAPNVVTVTAAEFSFHTQRTIPAGVTTLRLVNQGQALHHLQVIRLAAGHTAQEFLQAMGKSDAPPAWATPIGGPNAPAPGGGVSEGTLDLQPGEYVLICMIPGPDGAPHAAHGMVVPLTVVPAKGPTAAEPRADVRMALTDYAFGITPEMKAGHHVVRVENGAGQPHEVFIARLAPGKTVQDLMAWLQNEQGPPPAAPVGGTSFLARGEVNYVNLDLAPGEYALLCFVPDAKDGKPHVAHGMFRQITVR